MTNLCTRRVLFLMSPVLRQSVDSPRGPTPKGGAPTASGRTRGGGQRGPGVGSAQEMPPPLEPCAQAAAGQGPTGSALGASRLVHFPREEAAREKFGEQGPPTLSVSIAPQRGGTPLCPARAGSEGPAGVCSCLQVIEERSAFVGHRSVPRAGTWHLGACLTWGEIVFPPF